MSSQLFPSSLIILWYDVEIPSDGIDIYHSLSFSGHLYNGWYLGGYVGRRLGGCNYFFVLLAML